jgi:hypothetical protein
MMRRLAGKGDKNQTNQNLLFPRHTLISARDRLNHFLDYNLHEQNKNNPQ